MENSFEIFKNDLKKIINENLEEYNNYKKTIEDYQKSENKE